MYKFRYLKSRRTQLILLILVVCFDIGAVISPIALCFTGYTPIPFYTSASCGLVSHLFYYFLLKTASVALKPMKGEIDHCYDFNGKKKPKYLNGALLSYRHQTFAFITLGVSWIGLMIYASACEGEALSLTEILITGLLLIPHMFLGATNVEFAKEVDTKYANKYLEDN